MPMNYNPYFGPTYPNYFSQAQTPQVQQPQIRQMEWVEGEVGAKAFQMPVGWPVNVPIALWDSTDTVIYLKSINQMGAPGITQKLRYTIEEGPVQARISGQSQPVPQETSQYVTKDDLDQFKKELRAMILKNNQNGSNPERNRGEQH